MKNKNIAVLLAATLAFTGCATTPEEQAIESAEMQQSLAAEKMEATIDEAPDWYIEPRGITNDGFYATGTALSGAIDRAQNEATLKAEYNLAKLYGQELSGLEQYFAEEMSGGELITDSRIVIEKLVKKTNVSGYTITNTKLFQENGKARYYVELFYPRVTFNAQVQQGLLKEGVVKEKADAAYELLQKRLQETPVDDGKNG